MKHRRRQLVLKNRVTVRMSCKDKKALKSAARNAKEKSISGYVRTTIFKAIRERYGKEAKRTQSTKA
jgi:hypothetical protein